MDARPEEDKELVEDNGPDDRCAVELEPQRMPFFWKFKGWAGYCDTHIREICEIPGFECSQEIFDFYWASRVRPSFEREIASRIYIDAGKRLCMFASESTPYIPERATIGAVGKRCFQIASSYLQDSSNLWLEHYKDIGPPKDKETEAYAWSVADGIGRASQKAWPSVCCHPALVKHIEKHEQDEDTLRRVTGKKMRVTGDPVMNIKCHPMRQMRKLIFYVKRVWNKRVKDYMMWQKSKKGE